MPNQYLPFQPSQMPTELKALFFILFIWSVVWKLIALWKAAKHGQKGWFVVLYLVNLVGLLELIYLGFFQKGEKNIIEKVRDRKTSKNISKRPSK